MACAFCAIVAGEAPAHVVWSDERTLAFMDRAPLVPGHVLVIPRTHSAELWEMSLEDGAAVMRTTLRVAAAVKGALNPEGMNLFHSTGEAAGQDVFHVHLHVVPRWRDDGFLPPVIPHRAGDPHLADTAARIRAEI